MSTMSACARRLEHSRQGRSDALGIHRRDIPVHAFGRDWPEASVRCLAAMRPKSGVKPTCQDGPTDAIDPTRTSRSIRRSNRQL
jgi:hypothetical protein